MAFADAEVDALLLLADAVGPARTVASTGRATSCSESASRTRTTRSPARPTVAHSTPRWSGSIHPESLALYQSLIDLGASRLGEFASVDIGVVTGANRFFILDVTRAHELRIPDRYLIPVIESAGSLSGLTVIASHAKRLLRIDDEPKSKALLRYLAAGVADRVSDGYKCRTRRPWYRVPVPRQRPDLLLPYMNHHGVRLFVNRSRIWSTNLVHEVALRAGAPDPRALAAASLSAAVMLSAEIEGRAYGGGVLKVETKEAEQLLFPAMTQEMRVSLVSQFAELSRMVRRGAAEAASALVDHTLGINHAVFRAAAEAFRRRRLGRKASV